MQSVMVIFVDTNLIIDFLTAREPEDCLQDRCAEGIGANYIITRNVDDFSNSKIQAILPEIFLEQLKCSQNPAGGCGEGE